MQRPHLKYILRFLPIVIICSITVLFFWQFFFLGRIPFPGDYLLAWYEPWRTLSIQGNALGIAHKPIADDIFRHQYPMKTLAMSMIATGQFPLWNPYNGSGQPLFAMMHPGFLNPFNIFFLIFSKTAAWALLVIFQIPVLGSSMFLYTRKLGLSKVACYFASFAFIVSGFIVVRLLYTEFLYVLALLPILLYLFERFHENTSSKSIFYIPLAVALLFFTGQPQMILYVLLTIGGYALYRSFHDVSKKNLLIFFLFLFLGAFIAAIQLVPTIELYKAASISPHSSTFIFKQFLLPLSHLTTILIPNYFGSQATYNFWGISDYTETATYIGLLPCFFFVLSFLWKPLKNTIDIRRFLLCIMLLSIVSTLDWFGSRAFFSLPIPILATGVPSRIFTITLFAIAILAGYGMDAWIKQKSTVKKYLLFMIPSLGFVLVIVGATFFLYIIKAPCPTIQIPECRLIALRNTLFEFAFFIVGLGFFFCPFIIRKKATIFLSSIGIILLVVIFGYYNLSKFLPFTASQNVMPANILLHTLQEKTTDGRYFSMGDVHIKADIATQFRIYDPIYFDPLYIRRYGELIDFANTGILSSDLSRSDVEIINDTLVNKDLEFRRNRLFDILSVRYLIYNKKTTFCSVNTLWSDTHWCIVKKEGLPFAYIVSSIIVQQNSNELLRELFSKNFDPTKSVLLEQPIPVSFKNSPQQLTVPTMLARRENSLIIQTQTDSTAMLILTDTYFPGWKAYVDGKETKIYRANYTLRGIILPKGKHLITFQYDPLSLKIGIIISGISLFLLFLFFLLARRKQ